VIEKTRATKLGARHVHAQDTKNQKKGESVAN